VPIAFWDASALAKRYVPEVGSDVVKALFSAVPQPQMVGTVVGYAETFSILLRHHNRGTISRATFLTAKSLLRAEVVNAPDFTLLTVDDAAVSAGVPLIEKHNLNAHDAAILALVMRYLRILPPPTVSCVLIAADQRFLGAAQAEGLKTLNPELVAVADVPAFLAAL
jgi:predicted nucleic acid-binding protein